MSQGGGQRGHSRSLPASSFRRFQSPEVLPHLKQQNIQLSRVSNDDRKRERQNRRVGTSRFEDAPPNAKHLPLVTTFSGIDFRDDKMAYNVAHSGDKPLYDPMASGVLSTQSSIGELTQTRGSTSKNHVLIGFLDVLIGCLDV